MPARRIGRRSLLKTAAGAAAALAARAPAARRPRRPNLLFLLADDHTSQAWGCYGSRLSRYAPTKNIDRIAAEGALLRNCFCTNSICVPSRATILTGQYSHVHGARTLTGRLDPAADNVAKRLRQAGYETAVIGKWHLKTRPAGFDYYNVLRGQGRYHDPVLYEAGRDWTSGGVVHKGHSTDVITDLALKWLAGREDPSRPFCLMCHFKAVHEPFYAHQRYRRLLADVELPEPVDLLGPTGPENTRVAGWPLEILKGRFLARPNNYAPPPLSVAGLDAPAARRATYQKFVKDYLRCVAGLDENVGRLLARLEEMKIADDTVVIYTSDQGYFLGEHNFFDKRFMLEESLRMPFVLRYPREVRPGTVLEEIILNIDFAELLLDYAGADIPPTMQGRSFRANLRGETPADWRDAMYYHYWAHQPQRPSHYGIRTRDRKLIFYYGLLRTGRPAGQCWEFYDLAADPHETVNRFDDPKYAEEIRQLTRRLESLRKRFKDTADPLGAPPKTKRKGNRR